MVEKNDKGNASINPRDFTNDGSGLLKLINETLEKQIYPLVAERNIRKHLRLSHGDIIEILPTAIERMQTGYGLRSFTVATQWLSLYVDKLMSEHPVAVSCMEAFQEAQDRAEGSRIVRSIIDKGSGFTVTSKAQRGTPIYAFSYKTANSVEAKSVKMGLPTAHSTQIFSCLALSECSDCLKQETIDELKSEALEGLRRIELFGYCLRFESKL